MTELPTATTSPGTAFAAAFAEYGDRTEVTYDYTITGAHKPDRPKPRLTVPRVLKRQMVTSEEISYWYESTTGEKAAAVTESGLAVHMGQWRERYLLQPFLVSSKLSKRRPALAPASVSSRWGWPFSTS